MPKLDMTLFVGARVKDLPEAYVDSHKGVCVNCRDEVWISNEVGGIAERAAAIVCLPCIMELQGKNMEELVITNAADMITVLEEEIRAKRPIGGDIRSDGQSRSKHRNANKRRRKHDHDS